MSTLSFSIVINTLNRADHLRNAIRSLQYLRHDNFEVIVINGPSTDDTQAVMEEFSELIRPGHCPEANLSMSRNIGIAMAQGDVVCFLDDDAIPEPDWLDALERAYLSDPKIGAVGGFIRDHSGVNFQSRYLLCDRYGDSQAFDSLDEIDVNYDEPGSWQYISQTGCNSSFRRTALLEVGGFDEEFAYFLDETDVNLRVRDAGWLVRIEAEAEVHHKYAPSAERDHSNTPKRLYFPLRSKAYFCLRHAAETKPLAEILRKLSKHATEVQGHNQWYIDNKVITREHFERLTNDVRSGVLDGTTDAFSQNEPALLSEEALNEFATSAFKKFPTKCSAENRLRMVFLSQDYPPGQTGGIGVWTQMMAEGLAARGHEVSVIARSSSGAHTVDFENGVFVHRILPTWDPRRTEPAIGDVPQVIKDYCYAAFDEVVRIHLRRGVDVVSAPIWDLEGLAVHASGLFPVVTSLHTTFKLALPHKPDWLDNPQYRKNHVDKVIAGEERLLKESAYILANSKAVTEDLVRAHPSTNFRPRITTIPHGYPTAPAATSKSANPGIEILFIGRLETRKGADLLLNIVPNLLSKNSTVRVKLIGNDTIKFGNSTMKQEFLAQHKDATWIDRVEFLGFVSDEDKNEAIARCDIFVAPSRYESFGLIFLEAMRLGKPSVGASVGGIEEVIKNGVEGLLPPPGDPAELESALCKLIKDTPLREKMGRSALTTFQERFTLDGMISKAESFYAKVVNNTQGIKSSNAHSA